MISDNFTESVVEQAALAWLESLDYTILAGPQIAPGEAQSERDDYRQVVLFRRLRQALQRLNPQVPSDALEEAFRKLSRMEAHPLATSNHAVHKYLVEGVPVEYQRIDGSIGGDLVRVLDFANPDNNEFLAVSQFTIVEDHHERRPDIVLFVNGLPLAVLELKNATSEDATIWSAFNQLQTYKEQIPSLFVFNEALLISDGVQARVGTLTADREWFMPWRTIEGEELADTRLPQLQVVLEGIFERRRFLDLIRHFIVFEDIGNGALVKKMAGYHQYHAVNLALDSTVKAAGAGGDKRVGVVWHTQGSGKSLTMVFYAGRVVLHQAMENPTLVVITDRNDLDDQLLRDLCPLSRTPPSTPGAGTQPRRSEGITARRSRAVSSLPRCRSSSRRKERISIHVALGRGATSWSLPTRPTAANMISLTDSPVTCARHCQTHPS